MSLFFKLIILVVSGSLLCISSYAAPANIPSSQIQLDSLSLDQLQQAAEAGDPDAQYALGYLYFTGKNVPEDKQTGLNWIKRASVQGQEQAIEAMRVLGNPMGDNSAKTASKVTSTTTVSSEETDVVSTPKPNNRPAVSPLPAPAKSTPVKPATVIEASSIAILNAPANYYTIQLLLTSNKAELQRYINTHALGNKAHYYTTKKGYVLLYGSYKTRAEARADLLKLPGEVKAQRPWVKEISQVKKSIS
jgi:DamX protein